MDSGLDRDAKAWAATIARAYAAASRTPITPETEAWLARELKTALADCIGIPVPPSEWGPDYINPSIARWEVMARKRRGPQLDRVDYGNGAVTMGW